MVNRFGPFGAFDSCTILGKLWRPLGNCSTSISQSLMSTFSMISSRLKMLHHGRLTRIRLALEMDGRSAADLRSRGRRPRTPGQQLDLEAADVHRPLEVLRAGGLGARAEAGPRSMVSDATRTPQRARPGRRARAGQGAGGVAPRGGATDAGAGSAAGCSGGGEDSSSTLLD